MEHLTIEVDSPAALDDAAAQILSFAGAETIFLLYGQMGAGKTTLVKSLARAMGITETVSSPTFSIVNQYLSSDRSVFHFDFYRIKDLREAYDIGYEEYFYSGDLCLVEWPEKIDALLPEHYLKIEIQVTAEDQRLLLVSKI